MALGHHLEQSFFTERTSLAWSYRGVAAMDTRVKIGLLFAVILLNSWVAQPWLSAGLLAVGIALLAWSQLPFSRMQGLLLFSLWPSLAILLACAVGFGTHAVWTAGPFTVYAEGITRGLTIMVRAYCALTWILLCLSTTPTSQVFAALRWYRIPSIVTETLAMMYRYAFVCVFEFQRMRLAAHSRGGRAGYLQELHTLGRIAAQLFMRGFDRSERIHLAMVARGGERDA